MRRLLGTLGIVPFCVAVLAAVSTLGGALPGPLPLFPADNWWNLDISIAPVDPNSAAYINFINNGSTRQVHPDFGGGRVTRQRAGTTASRTRWSTARRRRNP
jgi:hypothetical protein